MMETETIKRRKTQSSNNPQLKNNNFLFEYGYVKYADRNLQDFSARL